MSGIFYSFFISSPTSDWVPRLTKFYFRNVSQTQYCLCVSQHTGFGPGLDPLLARVFNLTANIFSLIPFLPQPVSRLLLKNKCVHITILKNYYGHSLMHGTHAKLLTYCVSVRVCLGPYQPPVPVMTLLLLGVCTQASFSMLLNTLPFQPFNGSICLETSSQFPSCWCGHSETVFRGLLLMTYSVLWALMWVHLYICLHNWLNMLRSPIFLKDCGAFHPACNSILK